MEDANTHNVLGAAVTDNEWAQIPSKIRKKLETFFVQKFDEFFTAKALSETNRFNAGKLLQLLVIQLIIFFVLRKRPERSAGQV